MLPKDLLAQRADNIIVTPIDFKGASLGRYDGLYAVVLDNVLSPVECKQLRNAAEASADQGWERAMINAGGGRQVLIEDLRSCGRIIWDSQEVVDKVWKRIEHIPVVQEILRLKSVPKITGNGPAMRGEVWRFSRPNERMRFLKYNGGEYFRPHCDGTYETPDKQERSYFTLHLYLSNSVSTSGAELAHLSKDERLKAVRSGAMGGATTFHSIDMREKLDVLPKAGRILLFQHRDLLHSGDDVIRGVKYTMRTDLMYLLERDEPEGKRAAKKAEDAPDEGGLDGREEGGKASEEDWYAAEYGRLERGR